MYSANEKRDHMHKTDSDDVTVEKLAKQKVAEKEAEMAAERVAEKAAKKQAEKKRKAKAKEEKRRRDAFMVENGWYNEGNGHWM